MSFLLAIGATTQDITLPPPGPIPKTAQQSAPRDYSTSCTLPETAAACRSYNELVTSRDADLIQLLTIRDAYVCFRENQDVFNVIAIDSPRSTEFKKMSQNGFYQARPSSYIVFHRFKNGQTDHRLLIAGKWTKFDPASAPYFTTIGKESPVLDVSDSEITLSEEYRNITGGKTNYTFRIRRSTMKATETFQWDNPPPEPKAGPDRGESTDKGHCISFN